VAPSSCFPRACSDDLGRTGISYAGKHVLGYSPGQTADSVLGRSPAKGEAGMSPDYPARNFESNPYGLNVML
jgi:hypothetical protein